jgi:starch-binding outer membrane protein, SusD/RagB family
MRIRYTAVLLGALALGACKDATRPDLNNPSVGDFSTITDRSQVQALATGVLFGDRGQIGNQILYGETIGRDGYRLTGSEPRFVTELLGPAINSSDFLGGALWPYGSVRLSNIGISGVTNAPAAILSPEEQQATLGYLRTIKALLYLRIVEMHDTTGAPINVDIPATDPPAPLSCANDVRNYIAALLDSAATNLSAGGSSFPFVLSPGFSGFDDPASFLTFNRALAAKTDIYIAFRNYAASGSIDAAALTAASDALAASFMTQDAAQLDAGPAHNYSTNSGDATNPLFESPSSTVYRANPRVVTEADPGDQRVATKIISGSPITQSGLTSSYIYVVYTSPSSPISIITNKELLLMKAEVLWGQGDYPGALALSNFVRVNDGGLTAKTTSDFGSDLQGNLLNEILKQKRYSLLWQSADRLVDSRLFGKLNGSAPPAGVGQERSFDPLQNFPIPFNESSARSGDLSQQCTATN